MNPYHTTDTVAQAMDAYVATGTVDAAAARLGVSPHTVRTYLKHVRRLARDAGHNPAGCRAGVLWERARRGTNHA